MKGGRTDGDIEVEVASKFRCLKSVTYVSLAKLQPTLSYEPHSHVDHEEIYYIISGKGSIKIGKEVVKFRDGDVIYIPEKITHSITNDGDEMVEFLAFGGITGDPSRIS
jgi:mannose-6-phosphate isomerase-like protein (cupin superfamily)